MKATYKNLKPKITTCRNYKSFSNDSFREALQKAVSNEDNYYAIFEILFQHAREF